MTRRVPVCLLAIAASLGLLSTHGLQQVDAVGPVVLDPNLTVETVVEGLSQPTSMAFIGRRDILVLEKATGKVRRVVRGVLQEPPVLDLAVNSASERGLLGMALHPDFPGDRGVYLFWTESTATDAAGAPVDTSDVSQTTLLGNRVDRFEWNGSSLTFARNITRLRAFQADEGQPLRGNHNGGIIRFELARGGDERLQESDAERDDAGDGDDHKAKLFIIIGDNGRRGQLQNLADGPFRPGVADDQFGGPEPDDAHLTGVVLRLNDDGTTPRDNPFFRVGARMGGPAGANVQKIFAYGIRNSFGMAVDPWTGDLWEQENGDDAFDEINRVTPGSNNGWVQVMGPLSRVSEFKEIETSPGFFGLQQIRWPPTSIADSPEEALARMLMLPRAHYRDPVFSWKYAVAPAGIGFLSSRSLGREYEGNLFVGAARTFLDNGYLMRFRLTENRQRLSFSDARLRDRVADNATKFDGTESESLRFGTGFGVGTDIQTGPNGNLFVVSLSNGAIYEIRRARLGAPEPASGAPGISDPVSGASVLAVTTTAPNGGEKLYTGTPYTIAWTATEGSAPIDHFDVERSSDGGLTWSAVPGCSVPGSARSCVWSSPGPVTTKGKIRVKATDTTAASAVDASNAVFRVSTGTAYATVYYPNAPSTNWGIGSHQQITWRHNLGLKSAFKVELSRDGVAYTETLSESAPATTASAGAFDWQVDGPVTSQARVRVTWVSGPTAVDVSNANFTIAAPFISIVMPKATANWGYQTSQMPKWTSNLGPEDLVNVLLSTDGGASFPTTLATGVGAAARQALVTTPTLSSATTAARVKVEWSNAPPGFAAAAVNTGNFKVGPAFVTVSSPNGGELWNSGTTQTISWAHNLGPLENVKVELSQDGGATYPITIASSTASDGKEAVTVASGWSSSAARLRITSLDDPTVSDGSNADFTIAAPPFISVSGPNGGESWNVGATQAITWTSNLPASESVKIELSRDGGATYPIVVLASTPADGVEHVTVMSSWASPTARIRIASMANPAVNDASNGNFAIVAGPFITVSSPNGGETWTIGSTAVITWSGSLPPAEMVRIELSEDGGVTYPHLLTPSTPSDGTENVSVLADWETAAARIRVTSVTSPGVTDASNANFAIQATVSSTISIVDFSFMPPTFAVSSGTTVTWRNNGSVPHTSTSGGGLWDSGMLPPGGTFNFTFTTPGEFPYECQLHFGMTGKVVVK